jgi:hypothetical protein
VTAAPPHEAALARYSGFAVVNLCAGGPGSLALPDHHRSSCEFNRGTLPFSSASLPTWAFGQWRHVKWNGLRSFRRAHNSCCTQGVGCVLLLKLVLSGPTRVGDFSQPFKLSKELFQTRVTPNSAKYPCPRLEQFELGSTREKSREFKQKSLPTAWPVGFLFHQVGATRHS